MLLNAVPQGFLWKFALFFSGLGGFGLFLLGVLDSSFLFMPLGNDLLVVALTARHHARMPYYAAMAAAGSVLGCFFTDWVSRKGGEKGLENHAGRAFEYVRRKVEKNAAPALALACILPPPFPFTPFIIVLAALQYPRWKLLGIVAAGRSIRFLAEGSLAIAYGKQILQFSENRIFQQIVIALVVISIGGSVWSIYSWVRKSGAGRASRRASPQILSSKLD